MQSEQIISKYTFDDRISLENSITIGSRVNCLTFRAEFNNILVAKENNLLLSCNFSVPLWRIYLLDQDLFRWGKLKYPSLILEVH